MNLLKSGIGRLRITGYLEGISFLLLLGVAMPIKYMYGIPEATKVIGLVHGIFFILYVIFLIEVRSDYKWGIRITLWSFIAAFLPFGTFVADAKIFRNYRGK